MLRLVFQPIAAILLYGAALYGQSATLVKTDAATRGNWVGVYGSEGYSIPEFKTIVPPYLMAIAPSGSEASWGSGNGMNAGALLSISPNRIASCWYTNPPSPGIANFTLSLNFTDKLVHQVALYFDDFDGFGGGRNQVVTVRAAASGTILSASPLSKFGSGVWLVYGMSGAVTIEIANVNPNSNGILTGIFFDPVPVAPTLTAPPAPASGIGLCAGVAPQAGLAAVLATNSSGWCWNLAPMAPGLPGPAGLPGVAGAAGAQGPPGVAAPPLALGPGLLKTSQGIALDSAFALTRPMDVAGSDHALMVSGGPLIYTATTAIPLQSYALGQWWIADFPNGANATLDLGLGPLPLKNRNSGLAATGGECTNGCLLIPVGSPQVNALTIY
jgi:hypothetical protein